MEKKFLMKKNNEIIFYTACLALYRAQLLISNGTIPQNMQKTKWHMLPLVRIAISGEEVPYFNSKKIENYCSEIIKNLSTHQAAITPFHKATDAISNLGELTKDRLKRQAVLEEMIKNLNR